MAVSLLNRGSSHRWNSLIGLAALGLLAACDAQQSHSVMGDDVPAAVNTISSPPEQGVNEPADWQLVETLSKTLGHYPQQIHDLMEPCDDALISYYRNTLARDPASEAAGSLLTSVCDPLHDAILNLKEPATPNEEARFKLHMWAVTLALQARMRGGMGRVTTRYARLENGNENIDRDREIIVQQGAEDRVRSRTASAFLAQAAHAIASPPGT